MRQMPLVKNLTKKTTTHNLICVSGRFSQPSNWRYIEQNEMNTQCWNKTNTHNETFTTLHSLGVRSKDARVIRANKGPDLTQSCPWRKGKQMKYLCTTQGKAWLASRLTIY